jgi:predicted adenine nucleotide alpha hydrolase (AANH) superfamily ATPase
MPQADGAAASDAMLLHICCAPCATYPVVHLRGLGYSLTGYWYNPNIQPWTEHEARRQSLVAYAALVGLPMVWERGYDTAQFLAMVAGHERKGERCAVCYSLRLGRAAAAARRLGLPRFTTTLLVSPYQDQAMLRRIGEEEAARHGVEFYFENMRRGWSERSRLTREYGLYRQQYCGCLFSEFERYTRLPIERSGEIDLENL